MSAVFLLLGLALLIAMLAEFVMTTIGASMRRMITHRWAGFVFSLLRSAAGRRAPALLHQSSGPIVMCAVAALWIAWLSVAWTLVFMAGPGSVVHGPSGDPAGIAGTWGHVGHLLSTLGGGVTEPGGMLWYLAGVLAAVSGMVVLTLSVSFILTTTSTVSAGRALCALLKSYDPADPAARDTLLPRLADLVSNLNSAPFALYYSSPDEQLRLPARIAEIAARAASGPEFARWRRVLEDLPGLEPGTGERDAAFGARVEDWAARLALGEGGYSPSKAQSA